MDFQVVSTPLASSRGPFPRVLLVEDQWDDWFEFSTMYTVYVFDSGGKRHHIGSVKVGQFGMEAKLRRPALENEFEELDDRFFSLGQDDSYYDHLNELVPDLKDEILSSLRDLSYGESERFEAALEERVTTISLLRSVARASVRDQFRRIALGGVRLSPVSLFI